MSRKLMIALLVLGVVLIVAAGVAYLILSRQEAQPKPPEITLPPSLDEWAEAYPRLADILHNSELGSVYKEFLVKYEEEGEEAALELARQRGIVVTDEGKDKAMHPMLVAAMQFWTILQMLEQSRLYKAAVRPEYERWQRAQHNEL